MFSTNKHTAGSYTIVVYIKKTGGAFPAIRIEVLERRINYFAIGQAILH